jgi:hypothetical protein
MPSTPIAYNTGSTISGTTQTGSLAVGSTAQPYCNDIGGVKWWMGPEEENGFVIGYPVPANNHPTPIPGVSSSVGFKRSKTKTNSSFLALTNRAFNQTFTNASSASDWLTSNGYWNTYNSSATEFIVNVFQSGSGVVWYGEGGFNLDALTFSGSSVGAASGYNGEIWGIGTFGTASYYTGVISSPPTDFGNGYQAQYDEIIASQRFGITYDGLGYKLYVTDGYTSQTIISGTLIYWGETISSLGLYTGSYVWSWGSGSNFSSITMNIG